MHSLEECCMSKSICFHYKINLHSTVEDTDTSFEELVRVFGKKIADIVKDVTDDKSLSKGSFESPSFLTYKDERKRQQIAHASHCCYEAKLVKLGDKLLY